MTEINKKISVGNTNISVDTEKMNKTESNNKLLDNNLNKTESNNLLENLLDKNITSEKNNNIFLESISDARNKLNESRKKETKETTNFKEPTKTVNNNPKEKEKKEKNKKKIKTEQKSEQRRTNESKTSNYFDTYFESVRTLAVSGDVLPVLLSPRSKVRKDVLYKIFFNKLIFFDIEQKHLNEYAYLAFTEEKDIVKYQSLVLQYISNPNKKVSKKKILDPLNDIISEDTLDPTALLGYHLKDNKGNIKFYQFKFRIESIRPFNGLFQCVVTLREDQIPRAEKVQLNLFIKKFVLFYEQNFTLYHYKVERPELRLNIGNNTALKVRNLVFLPTTEIKAPKYLRLD